MRHQLQMKYLDTVARVGSIRKAAEFLSITSSALNRRILAMEEDFGVPLFDRVASGVRLNAAGEMVIHQFRIQLADMERVKSQLHDLQGERRGHISIACSQALIVSVLPNAILKYRAEHPNVTFSLRVCTRHSSIEELKSFNADISMVYEPEITADFNSLAAVEQQLHAQFSASHPLNKEGTVRLRDCLEWPLALPTRNNGIRHQLEQAVAQKSIELNIAIESDNFHFLRKVVQQGDFMSFTLPAGLEDNDQLLLHRPIDRNDVKPGMLHVGTLKNRHLPVPAAKFAEQLIETVSTATPL